MKLAVRVTGIKKCTQWQPPGTLSSHFLLRLVFFIYFSNSRIHGALWPHVYIKVRICATVYLFIQHFHRWSWTQSIKRLESEGQNNFPHKLSVRSIGTERVWIQLYKVHVTKNLHLCYIGHAALRNRLDCTNKLLVKSLYKQWGERKYRSNNRHVFLFKLEHFIKFDECTIAYLQYLC